MKRKEKKRMLTNRKQILYNRYLGFALTGVIALLFLIGLIHTPYDPNGMDITSKLAGVSLKHLFGCDSFGRDIFSRVCKGIETTFLVAFGTVLIGSVFGILIGAYTGFYGGWLDEVLMRINDTIFAFPSFLLALIFVSIFGSGKYIVILALGIAFIPSFARIVRSEFMKCKEMDYVKLARLAGASNFRIMFVHILPNIFSVLLSAIMIGFNNAVLAEAGMSYLGIGVQPPDASLGSMLSDAQSGLFTAPWCAIFPGLTIMVLVLGFSLLSDSIKRK